MMLAVLSTSSKADPASTTIPAAPAADAEFVFARVAFTTNQLRGGNRRSSLWRTDYPDAEHHFLGGVRRLTRVDADPDGHVLTLSSDEVFDYPWLYAVEVGGWHLDLDEARRLREYLLRGGRTWEQDGFEPHWRGVYDDDGRLMLAINFNMDMGDAWEHADWPEYPEPMTALAYRFGINYLLYAMTH